MRATQPELRFWESPSPKELGSDHVEFLHRLDRPTWITVKGKDSSRRRAIVTLLHANEASGLKAVYRYLRSGTTPVVDAAFLVASVDAALSQPILSHRFLPGERDLNRLFPGKAEGGQSGLAANIVEALSQFEPELVIDLHNTSSHSPPFGVTYSNNDSVRSLTALFANNLIVLDRRLGTLVEQSLPPAHLLTVEVGGMMDTGADRRAEDAVHAVLHTEAPFALEKHVRAFEHPLRLELEPGAQVAYASTTSDGLDLVLPNTLDQLNFAATEAGSTIGWLGPRGLDALRALDRNGADRLAAYFAEREGELLTTRAITIFMATTDPFIAANDCVFYFCPLAGCEEAVRISRT